MKAIHNNHISNISTESYLNNESNISEIPKNKEILINNQDYIQKIYAVNNSLLNKKIIKLMHHFSTSFYL